MQFYSNQFPYSLVQWRWLDLLCTWKLSGKADERAQCSGNWVRGVQNGSPVWLGGEQTNMLEAGHYTRLQVSGGELNTDGVPSCSFRSAIVPWQTASWRGHVCRWHEVHGKTGSQGALGVAELIALWQPSCRNLLGSPENFISSFRGQRHY